MVGESNGCLSQYGRNPSGDFKKHKDYGNVGVGEVSAIDWSWNFAVVGGRNGKISLIDIKNRQVIQKGIQTAIANIYSLKFCRISQSEMHLAAGGLGMNYSFSKTDLFDVSKLLNLGPNKSQKK